MNRPTDVPAPLLVIVVGPTAAGKSALAVHLARRFGGEIVSADALQVYRGLDIGTGKVGPALRAAVPHHGIDVAEPTERFSAARWVELARAAIEEIEGRGALPVLAGGTGFYVEALVEGLSPAPPRDERWRGALERLVERAGLERAYEILRAHDPRWAERVGPGDRQRILRGLEVTLRTGEPFSEYLERHPPRPTERDPVWIGITWPRPQLYERIAARVDAMLEEGWLDEVRGLLERGVPHDAHAMQAIGYRQLAAHLAGESSLEEARTGIVRATRRYAKRQLSWFRNRTPARWFVREESGGAGRDALHRRVVGHLEAVLR